MRVLIVCSEHIPGGISPVIINQAESLVAEGIEIEYFGIHEKGIRGYLRSIGRLRKHLRTRSYDIIHAHYSLSAFVASLAFPASPVIASLMGSDAYYSKAGLMLIRLFIRLFWKVSIVKSEAIRNKIGTGRTEVIPNGVNMEVFKPADKPDALQKSGWDKGYIHVLFGSSPGRPEKNFSLVDSALRYMDDKNIQLHFLENIPRNEVPVLLNASDVLVLSSLWEGSPNIIKEAMACNTPIVSTDTGDVSWLFKDTEGCFISGFSEEEYADKLKSAIGFSRKAVKPNGRDRIFDLGLDSGTVAGKIVNIYRSLVS